MKTRSETFIGRSRAMRAVPPPPFPVFERWSGTTSAVVVGCRALVWVLLRGASTSAGPPRHQRRTFERSVRCRDKRCSIVKLAVELKECKCGSNETRERSLRSLRIDHFLRCSEYMFALAPKMVDPTRTLSLPISIADS